MTISSRPAGTFARRVTAVLSTKVAAFSLSLATAVIISRVLGPEGKGAYVAVIALPGLLGGIGVFGLPGAVNYFSARGASTRGLLGAGLLFTAVLSTILVALVWVSLPWLETTFLSAAKPTYLLRVVLLTVPAAFMSTFGMAVLYGRQQVRTYSMILLAQGVTTLVLSTLLVAVFRFGVPGAVASSITVTWLVAIVDVIAVFRLSKREPGTHPVPFRALTGYGLKLYPASITGYFNYRIDTFIIQAVASDAKVSLGLYSNAVTMAELLFYVPDSITMIFLPRVAGGTQEEADALVGRVSRLTILVTCLGALALIPAAFAGVYLVLPKFVPSLPAFLVLLPGIVALSVGKVMTSYLSGRKHPGIVSICSGFGLVTNVIANFILIPPMGIAGAAVASLISYSAIAALLVVIVSRFSRRSVLSLLVPRREELRLLIGGASRGLARARQIAARRGRRQAG